MFIATRVRRSGAFLVACMVGAGALVASPANAAIFTLTDDNSFVSFDTTSQAGAFEWNVDGVNQLYQQWFWYRVGQTAEQSIDTLAIGVQGIIDSNFDGDPETLFVRYLGAGFRLDVRFVLNGGSPGSLASDLAEQITIVNTGDVPLDFHFFQYNDYDLGGTSGGDTVVFTNNNAVQQFKGSSRFTETVVTPVASHRELGIHPATLSSLNDGLPTNLSDSPANGVQVGPGDVTWAFQWDFVIPVGGSRLISKNKNIQGTAVVPEPASWALLAGGGALLALRRLRTRRRKVADGK